ncbi:hypothetical protein VTN02DRAFT_3852 [Thermoascus thermophilus]
MAEHICLSDPTWTGATPCALLSERGSEGGMARDEHDSNTGQDFLTVIRLSFVICD